MVYVGPDMFDLMKIVIPKIMNEWEYVAEVFRYDIPTIKSIKERGCGDPKKCCREFFMDWLQTNRGVEVGPKLWSTLLNILREVDEISADTIDSIIVKVKYLKYNNYCIDIPVSLAMHMHLYHDFIHITS